MKDEVISDVLQIETERAERVAHLVFIFLDDRIEISIQDVGLEAHVCCNLKD